MEHCMSLFYLVYKYWSHKYCWLKLGNENIKAGKHVNLENLSKQQQQQQKNNFGDKEDEERKRSMRINVLLMVSVPYLQKLVTLGHWVVYWRLDQVVPRLLDHFDACSLKI